MIIILENIFYFILILTVVFLYGYVIKVIYFYVKQIIKEKKLKPQKDIFNIVPNTQVKKVLLLVFILFNISMHLANRSTWINKETSNHDAKEYLATYIDLHFYKKVLNNFFHIDKPIFIPLNFLTDQIYKQGIQHLPKDDGEIGFWDYYFYAYFYARGSGYMPNINRTENIQPSTKEQIAVLDLMYGISQTLATKKIKDKKVYLEKYKTFASVADYFMERKSWYFGNHRDSSKLDTAREDKEFMKKLNLLLHWALQLKKEYKHYPKLKEELDSKNPVLGVSYFRVIIELSEFILTEKYVHKYLRCDDRLIDVYMDNKDELFQENSSLYKLSKSQELLVKKYIFNTYNSKILSAILNYKCQRKVSYAYPTDEWIKNNTNFK